jgi:hypothetical protein
MHVINCRIIATSSQPKERAMMIFGKKLPMEHQWCPTLIEWVNQKTCDHHPIGVNVECDGRVPDDRFNSMQEHTWGAVLPDGLKRYFLTKVQNPAIPEFGRPANALNRVDAIDPETELVWILDLTGLYAVAGFLDAIERRTGVRAERPSKVTDAVATVYFDTVLGEIGPDFRPNEHQRGYLSHVLTELGGMPRHPIWASLFSDFERHLRSGPERWLEILGVSKPVAGRYIAAIKYSCGQRTLYRPCFADAVPHLHHHVTPAAVPADLGGRAMDLSEPVAPLDITANASGHDHLLTEYIHAHATWDLKNAQITGLGKTRSSVGQGDPVEYRRRQRARLGQLWPLCKDLIDSWPD